MRTLAGRMALVVAAAVLVGAIAFANREGPEVSLPAADGSTLKSTWVDPDGDGLLEVGPAEPLQDRVDLAPASPVTAPIADIVQISDAHVRDEESPARATLLDRLSPLISEAARPQEALSGQVLEAALRAAAVTRPDAVLETGDLIDSAQANELDQAISILEGGEVDPDSGAPGYDGLQDISNPDPLIYRPDLDSPQHQGLLDEAQEPFMSAGIAAPWYPVLGNHDILVQGEVPPSKSLERIATGNRELVALDPDLAAPRNATQLNPRLVERYLGEGLPGRTEKVPADPERRHLSESEVITQLRNVSDAGDSGSRLEYTFDIGDSLRVIVMDAVNREGGAAGLVLGEQLEWLQGELDGAGDRWVIVATHQPLLTSEGGDAALAILDRAPRVIAAVSGHTHATSIEPRDSPAGGYWLISTPSLADYPQQARYLSVNETRDGIAIETWMIDTAPGGSADIARELAYLDAGGGRPDEDQGTTEDRNARLYLSR